MPRPEVGAGAVEEYLRSKSLEVWRASGGRELTMQCMFCGETHRKGKLYVNAEYGAWQCFVCGVSGSFRQLMEHFGDRWDDDHPMAKPSRRLAINGEYLVLAEQHLWASEAVLGYLRGRGIADATIREFRLGYHPKGRSLVDDLPGLGSSSNPKGYARREIRETGLLDADGREFLEGRLIIPYLSGRHVLSLRGRQQDVDWGGKYVTPPGDQVRLFHADALRGAGAVLLCEGEMDAMLAWQHLSSSPDVRARQFGVVAIPGAEALPGGDKGFPDFFEPHRRVYVCLDTDDTGRRAALRVKDLLGSKVRIVDLGRYGDLGEFFAPGEDARTWADLMRLIAEADMRSKRIYTVREAEAQAYELEHSRPGIKLGWPSLDALLAPGLYPGAAVVILAKTGAGKTAVLLMATWANRHRPTLFITLELTVPEVWRRLLRIARFYHPEMTQEQHMDLFPNLRIMDENAIAKGDFDQIVDEFAEETGGKPELVLLDHLTYMAHGTAGRDQRERTTNAMVLVKKKAKEHELVVIVPAQVSRNTKEGAPVDQDAGRESGEIEELADFQFGFWRPWEAAEVRDVSQPGYVQSEIVCRILKSRRGNKGRQVRLHTSAASLVIVDPTDRAGVNKVQMENEAHNRGERYEEIWKSQHEKALADLQGRLAPWERE